MQMINALPFYEQLLLCQRFLWLGNDSSLTQNNIYNDIKSLLKLFFILKQDSPVNTLYRAADEIAY
jgi:hypothetical protein